MPNFYVVKSGGTATADLGRATTQPTGSFASRGAANYYADIASAWAATTTPTNGDIFLISEDHAESGGSNRALDGLNGLTSDGIRYITVDDSNMDQAAARPASAQFEATGSVDVTWGGVNERVFLHNLYMKAGDDIRSNGANSHLRAEGCMFETVGSADISVSLTSYSYAELVNCDVKVGHDTGIPFEVSSGSHLRMIGGSVVTAATSSRLLSSGSFQAGGGIAEFIGVDLTAVSGASAYLLWGLGSSASYDVIQVTFIGCQLATGLADIVEDDLYGANKRVQAFNCSGLSADAEYQYYVNCDQSIAQENTSIYRTGSAAFPDSEQQISIQVDTAAHCSRYNPFWIDLPAMFAALSSASSNKLQIYLLSSDSGLTDQDVWAEVIYKHGTTKHVPVFLSTVNSDPLASGTALTSDSTAWTGRTSETRYVIELDTSGTAGMDGYPIVRLYFGKASLTAYACPTVNLAAA